jgi:hypothetical protein
MKGCRKTPFFITEMGDFTHYSLFQRQHIQVYVFTGFFNKIAA